MKVPPLIPIVFKALMLLSGVSVAEDNFVRPVPLSAEAPRMQVKEFVLDGAQDFPSYGLYVNELKGMLESERKRYEEGFDVEALGEITTKVTNYYRRAGLILTTAFLPEQEILDGRVIIGIVYGRLAGVSVEDNSLYGIGQLSKPYRDLVGAPVDINAVETALLLMNDYPGYESSAVFVPGETPGTSEIVIKTLEETSFSGQMWLDNYGSEVTGEYRLRGGITVNNLLDIEDRLALTLVQAFEPQNSLYGGIDYSFSYFEPAIRTGISYIKSSYDVGGVLAELGISGDSDILKFYGQGYLVRSRATNVYTTASLAQKNASSAGLGVPTEDKLTVLSASLGFDAGDGWLGGRHAGNITIHSGLEGALGSMDDTGDDKSSRLLSNGTRAGGGFTKVTAGYSHSFPTDFAPVLHNTYFLFRMELQQTSDELVSMERMSLGGPFSVRGYPIAEFLADSGQLISFEWIARSKPLEELPWLGNLQLSVYYDYASGTSNDALANEEDSATMSSLGFGAQVLPKDGFQVKVDLAFPLGSEDPSNDKSVQFYMTAGYRW